MAWLVGLALAGPWSPAAALEKTADSLVAEARKAVENDRLEEAVKKFREAFQLGPVAPADYRTAAEVLRTLERPADALATIQDGARHHPGDWALQVDLGSYLAGANRFEEAFEHYRKLDPKLAEFRPKLRDDEFYFFYGAAAEHTGRMDEAIRLFEKACALAPVEEFPFRAARSINYLGFLLLEQNRDVERAVELIHQANELAPNQSAYVDSLGWANFKTKQYPQALRELLRAEQLMQEEGTADPDILDHAAQAYFRLGHREVAIAYLRRAVELAPTQKSYQARIEEFLKAPCGPPVPLEFLKEPGNALDKKRSRRR